MGKDALGRLSLGGSIQLAFLDDQQRAAVLQQLESRSGTVPPVELDVRPGDTIERTLKVFNSTRHPDPIDVRWTVESDGRAIAGESRRFEVPPGEAEQFVVQFTAPAVTERTEGRFILIASRNGQEVFRDEKPLSFLARP